MRALRVRLRRRRPVRRGADPVPGAVRRLGRELSGARAGRPGLGLVRRARPGPAGPGARAGLADRRRLGHGGRPGRGGRRLPAAARELRRRHPGAVRGTGHRAGGPQRSLGAGAAAAGRRRHRDHGDAAPGLPARAAARLAGPAAPGGRRRPVLHHPGRAVRLARRLGGPLGRHRPGRARRPAAVQPAGHPGRPGPQPGALAGQPGLRGRRPAGRAGGRRGVRGLLPPGDGRDGDRAGGARPRRARARGERERRRGRAQGP